MVQVAWGNVLSIFLPGVVVMFAMRWIETPFAALFSRPAKLPATAAACLVVLATLAGGMLEALRRCTFDQVFSKCVNPDRPSIYAYLTPDNLALFQAGVENSYKYYAFYINYACAIAVVICVRIYHRVAGPIDLLFMAMALLLICAGYFQYLAYENRMKHFIDQEQARRERGT